MIPTQAKRAGNRIDGALLDIAEHEGNALRVTEPFHSRGNSSTRVFARQDSFRIWKRSPNVARQSFDRDRQYLIRTTPPLSPQISGAVGDDAMDPRAEM